MVCVHLNYFNNFNYHIYFNFLQANLFYGKSYYRLPSHEGTIRKEILEHGSVIAHLDVAHLNLRIHEGDSIYSCKYNQTPTHGIRLIGWGQTEDDDDANIPYWLAINSFGHQWGINGTFRILRGVNSCQVEQFVSAIIPKV